ncbi:hypothetical protein K1719_018779 [Acacia pycnantha]|nr:hypothetical protein K1719_018779 [Acacia pycnantha]
MAKTWYYYSAAVALLFLHCAAATMHSVRDNFYDIDRKSNFVAMSEGWGVPPYPDFYSHWASDNEFHPNDILLFNSSEGEQENVVEVTKESYDKCSKANTLGNVTNVPTNITLNNIGTHYFICTLGDHCSKGQKLAVNVVSTAPPPSSAAPLLLLLLVPFSSRFPLFWENWSSRSYMNIDHS